MKSLLLLIAIQTSFALAQTQSESASVLQEYNVEMAQIYPTKPAYICEVRYYGKVKRCDVNSPVNWKDPKCACMIDDLVRGGTVTPNTGNLDH